MSEFQPFPKIPRLNRPTFWTEKIDGTNAAVGITEPDRWLDSPTGLPGGVWAQSQTRVITPANDNFGFARWVADHADKLRGALGPGLHFGEWYGRGIWRGYGIREDQGAGGRFFALFNVFRWTVKGTVPDDDDTTTYFPHPWAPIAGLEDVPGLTVVPVLGVSPSLATTIEIPDVIGTTTMSFADALLSQLYEDGSRATGARGFPNPEGIVGFHKQGNVGFKATLENDEGGKERGG